MLKFVVCNEKRAIKSIKLHLLEMQTVKKIYMIDNCSQLANQFNM